MIPDWYTKGMESKLERTNLRDVTAQEAKTQTTRQPRASEGGTMSSKCRLELSEITRKMKGPEITVLADYQEVSNGSLECTDQTIYC
ncbi:hypothetical protein J6590_014628 [Homalodisca vitripennis]|nr:hypothetical protein J6590_014628 [Homalodisca vitripennis]